MNKPLNNYMGIDLSLLPMDILEKIRIISKQIGIQRIALVGGAVRDNLLNQMHSDDIKNIIDIDLVVEGSASHLATEIKSKLKANDIKNIILHKTYDSASMEIDGIKIDIASARLERYKQPGENPFAFPSNLEKDLNRRDFTINAIAFELNKKVLIDPKDGKSSVVKKKLDFLHDKSVEDDPSRIIRGARYASRLDLQISSNSLKQIQSTIKEWPWELTENKAPAALSTRLKQEIMLLLSNEPWERGIKYLQDWNALSLFDSSLQEDLNWGRRIRWAKRFNVNNLTAFIAGASNAKSLAKRLRLNELEQKLIAESIALQKALPSNCRKNNLISIKPSEWCELLERSNWSEKSVALTICVGVSSWPFLMRWWFKWRHIKSYKSAKELLKEGWKQGPELGQELKKLRRKKLDN